ncbi:MAG: substrate-binding domain-containing protein [Capsulimonadaceae bacterium]|nr:substrate-binding domain-containing protein [Capsulimonadaceae bacterium]
MALVTCKDRDRKEQMSSLAPRLRVIQHIQRGIKDGLYLEGERLPSERDLAQITSVTRSTVVRALAALSEKGVIRSNGGRLRIVNEIGGIRSGILRNTIVMLSSHPRGLDLPFHAYGTDDWIDQGAIDEVRKRERHFLAFHPAMIDSGDWEGIIQSSPFGIIVIDLLNRFPNALQMLIKAHEIGVPIVAYGFEFDLDGIDRVGSDHSAGVAEEVKWLYSQGCRRILMFSCEEEMCWPQERRKGYEKAVAELGLECLPLVSYPFMQGVDSAAQIELGQRVLAGYLFEHLHTPHPVDAILCLSDGELTSVDAACRILGKTPGKDLLLAGYDNFWAYKRISHNVDVCPAVTIDKENPRIGGELVGMLFDRVGGRLPAEPQHRRLEPRLILPDPDEIKRTLSLGG